MPVRASEAAPARRAGSASAGLLFARVVIDSGSEWSWYTQDVTTVPDLRNDRREVLLQAFLLEAFTSEELRIWVVLRYPDLKDSLPGGTYTREVFAYGVLEQLIRRGHVGAELFERLAEARPLLREHIAAIHALWGHGDAPGVVVSGEAPRVEGPHGVGAMAMDDFTGRHQALVDLEAKLLAGTTACVVVAEIGGIGKTALVLQFVATRGAGCFPGGVYWLDGHDLFAGLARICRRFGWTDPRDPTPEEATRWLRRALAGVRCLIVVDNFDPDGDPVHIPILGGMCRTLVTSRQLTLSVGLPNSALLRLGLWQLDECLEFLCLPKLRRVGDTDEELRALAEFVGMLPLGLRLVASLLIHRPGTSATSLLTDLQRQPIAALEKHRGAYPGLVATFQATWDALDADGRHVLQALAVCANETRSDIVAVVAAVEDPASALDMLATRSLVQFTGASSTPWSLHDVVRMFVLSQPGSGPFAERHVAWAEAHCQANKDPILHERFAAGTGEVLQAFV